MAAGRQAQPVRNAFANIGERRANANLAPRKGWGKHQ
ncbi:MAG: hypothetical protein JWP26_4012, partial [Devosia sp.]|nr:hypothetical protein [Devosia sp.]